MPGAAGPTVEWRVLGPVGVLVDGQPVPMGGSARRLLALFLATPGRLVSTASIVDGLWGDDPPAGADGAIQSYVSRLRRSLTEAGLDAVRLVVTRPSGYLLAVDLDAVDMTRFNELILEARHALDIGQPVTAAARIAMALALWRDDPFGEIGSPPFATRERYRLTETRLDAVELSLTARLAHGAAGELGDELERLVTEHPHRERLWAAMITAYYRADRQADALDAYQRARTVLADDLGVEPGPELRRLQKAVLDHDEELLRPGAAEPVELPAPVRLAGSVFVGRERELRRLTDALDLTACQGSRTIWLTGPEGGGRSRLVAELGRQAATRGVVMSYGSGVPAGHGLRIRVTDDSASVDRAEGCVLTIVIGGSAPGGADVIELGDIGADAIARIAALYGVDAAAVIEASAGLPGTAHDHCYRLAHARAVARVGAIVGDEAVRDPLSAAFAELVTAVRHVIEVRRHHVLAAGLAADPSPYKGLDRFATDDADLFFGRDDLTATLVARLARHGLLAVVGASGVGKSSIVAAGLIPALASGALPGSAEWPVLTGTPTRMKAAEVATFAPDSAGLIVVDQFEEVYVGLNPARRGELVGALLDAVERGHRCVLTIRSDFYGRLAEDAELAFLASANSVLVGGMTAEGLREAVTSPAAAVGLNVDEDLVDAVVSDMRGQEQALPLLSTALYAAFEQRTGSRLTLAAYQRSGGVTAAVERLAESAYQRLTVVEADAARQILVRLVDTGEDGQLVRRRVRLDQVVAAGENAERALAVLVAGRLVTVDAGTVEVSHEALITRWPRLAGWLADDSAGLAVRNRLVPAVREWQAADRDLSQLWSGPRLAAALDWAAEHPASLTGDESAFLDASLDAQTAGVQRRLRAQRRLRILAVSLAVALIGAVVAGGLATQARNAASAAEVLSDARRLGAQALVERDIRRAMLEAVAGIRLSDSWETRGNLLATLQRVPRLRAAAGVDDGDRILAMALRPDGREFAVGTGTGEILLYDPATMHVIAHVARTDRRGIYGLRYRPDGSLVAWGDRPVGPTTSSMQVYGTGLRASLPARTVLSALRGGTVTSDGSLIAVRRLGGQVVRIATDGTLTPVGVTADDRNVIVSSVDSQPRDADEIAVSADGQMLAVGGLQPLSVTDLASGATGRFGAGFPLAFSPDGRWLATDSGTGELDLWDVSSRSLVGVGRSQAGQIAAAAWSADGRRVVTCGDDRIVRVWSVATGTGTPPTVTDAFTGHVGRITACEFAPDSSAVYSAGLDGAIYVWDLQHENLLGSLVRPAEVGGGGYLRAYPAGDDGVLTVSIDDSSTVATLRRFDLGTGVLNPSRVTITEPDGFNDFAATPEGATLASVSAGGALSTWSSADGHRLSGPYRPLLPDELVGSAIGISGDGRLALVAVYDPHQAADGHVYRYDLGRGQLNAVMDLPGWVGEIDFSRDGRFAAAAIVDGRVVVWRTDTWTQVGVLAGQPPGHGPGALKFSDDGRYLAVGGTSGRPSLWNVGTWSLAWRAETGHNGFTTSLTFSPDGQLLISSGSDAKTFLYEIATGRDLGAAVGPDINLWTYSRFLGRSTTLASFGMDDGSVRQLDLDAATWLRRACSLAGRDLTVAEWQALVPDQPFHRACAQTPS